MSDDLGPLRRAMDDLSEHGGTADMYEGALARSRRAKRRSAILASSAAAVAVLAVGAGIVAIDAGRGPGRTPVADPASPSASLSPAPSPSASPTATRTTSRATTPPTSRPTSKPAVDDGCPVKASTLRPVAGLPDGYQLTASTVTCWHGWATSGVTAPSPDQQGDGVILFRYDPARGWRKHSEGSSFNCNDLGIKKIPGDPPPFCAFG